MSKASVTGQIIVTSNGTTIHTVLQCTAGDVYQYYDGEWSAPTSITPDYEATGATHPTIVFQAFSAEQGAGNSFDLSKASVAWIVAGVTLTFDAKGNSTNMLGGTTGHFVQGADDSGNPTLTVVKNLVKVNSGESFNIMCQATVALANTNPKLQAMFPVYIAKGTENAKRLSIVPADLSKLFTITEKGGGCGVKAQVMNGTGVSNTGYTFKWYLPDPTATDGWKLAQNSESAAFTVNEADVDSSVIVKCEAWSGSNFYASDVQTINDVSDEYMIYPNPTDGNDNPVAENFTQNSGDKIVYVPAMRKRGSTSDESGVTFDRKLYSNAGVEISGALTASDGKFTVTEVGLRDYKGAVYIITGTK